jgi:hypothetical protein
MTVRRAFLLLTLLAATWIAPAQAATFMQLSSQPREYVGQGIDRRIEGDSWTFIATYSPVGKEVIISAFGSEVRWDASFAAADLAELAPGVYTKAESAFSAGHPRLSVSGESRSCVSTGSFVVHEIEFTAGGGKVARFAADFEQHCGVHQVSLRGGVRYNSEVPYVDIAPAPFPPGVVAIYDAGGKFGGDRMLTNAVGGLEGRASNSGVQVSYDATSLQPEFGLYLQATSGPLVPGVYEGADSRNFVRGGAALAARINNASCASWTSGRFVVHEVRVGDYGVVEKFAADVEFYCEGRGSPVQLAVRLNSSVAVVRPPALPTIPYATQLQRLDNATSYLVEPGAVLDGLRLATVDDAGNRIPNEKVELSATCGTFASGNYLEVRSDTDGIVAFPRYLAPEMSGSVTCTVRARLPDVAGADKEWSIRVAPRGVPVALEAMDGRSDYQVPVNGRLSDVRMRLSDVAGQGVAGVQVFFVASCGHFDGGPFAYVTTDASGIVTMPPWTADLAPGDCTLSASPLQGGGTLPLKVHVVAPAGTAASGMSPGGSPVNLVMASNAAPCSIAAARFFDARGAASPTPVPTTFIASQGAIDLATRDCGAGQPVTFTLDSSQELPATTKWWSYGPTADDGSNHWYPVPTVVAGRKITFTLTDGGAGDVDAATNGSIHMLGMLAIDGGPIQDLWWAGMAENGWGMSLIQHGEKLFANLFVYDNAGDPTWYVMPSGSWDAAHMRFSGDLYAPKGSPFYAYDVGKFAIGASVGTATITLVDGDRAGFTYRINGQSGSKSITRMTFGPRDTTPSPLVGDLWWAGSQQDGWGISIIQQYRSLFVLWFTYDANGKATWYAMPAGSWISEDEYRGSVYNPVSSQWVGATYDPSRFATYEVGTFSLKFSAGAATFNYAIAGHSDSIALTRIPF